MASPKDFLTPRSPPLTPDQQLHIIRSHEEKIRSTETEPSKKDLEASVSESINEVHHWWEMSRFSTINEVFSFNASLSLTLLPQRYLYYITTGVPTSVLAPQPPQQMKNIMSLLPPVREAADTSVHIRDTSVHIQKMMEDLQEEVKRDYIFSLKKSIGTK